MALEAHGFLTFPACSRVAGDGMACHGRPKHKKDSQGTISLRVYISSFSYKFLYKFVQVIVVSCWTSLRSSHEDSRVRDSWAPRTHCTRPVRPLHCMINNIASDPRQAARTPTPGTGARTKSKFDFIQNYASNFSPRPSITTVAQAADRAPVPSNTGSIVVS